MRTGDIVGVNVTVLENREIGEESLIVASSVVARVTSARLSPSRNISKLSSNDFGSAHPPASMWD